MIDKRAIAITTKGVALVAVVLIALAQGSTAQAQYQIASADGKSSLKLGFLGQVQGEWLESADGTQTAQNLFVRRVRLLVGAKLGEKVSLFVETDSPNIGKAGADGRKSEATMYIQDLAVTYAAAPWLKLDAGMLLPPLTYHGGQGATSLLGIDYGPYGFLASGPTNSRAGRDYGVVARAYPFGQHLEVRAGVFQGVRGTAGNQPFRTFGRIVYYPLEAQTDLFYTGTTLGKRKLLGIGVSYDRQDDYSTTGADFFFDHPVGKGNAITVQLDYCRHDGRTFLKDLPRQDWWLVEAGFFFHAAKLEPFIQLTGRDYDDPVRLDEKFSQFGLAYWAEGHKFNFKVGVGKYEKDTAPDRTQVLAQLQLFLF